MSGANPIKQAISATQIPSDQHGNPIDYIVGQNCSRIEACEKPGEYCNIPYIRVWAGDECLAEFCQHKAAFVLFAPKENPDD